MKTALNVLFGAALVGVSTAIALLPLDIMVKLLWCVIMFLGGTDWLAWWKWLPDGAYEFVVSPNVVIRSVVEVFSAKLIAYIYLLIGFIMVVQPHPDVAVLWLGLFGGMQLLGHAFWFSRIGDEGFPK